MFTVDQLIAHAVGDYVLQSDWMANTKTSRSIACLAHVATYVLPFLLVTRSVPALAVIVVTHFVIDRWRLARYVCWAKNFLAPKHLSKVEVIRPDAVPGSRLNPGVILYGSARNLPWSECKATGYDPGRPAWMAVWLMIIVDNLMHVVCNGAAIYWLG